MREIMRRARAAIGSNGAVAVLALLWAAGIAAGVGAAVRYEITPGAAATAPASWPKGSAIARPVDRPVLVLFAHPRCSCTRASLHELAAILAESAGPIETHVLFLQPAREPEAWSSTDTWATATAMTGVSVARDEGGREAARFGARTSGQVVLYDDRGRLLFSGGITGMRGHEGNNAGRRRILSLIASRTADRPASFVFGCSLLDGDVR